MPTDPDQHWSFTAYRFWRLPAFWWLCSPTFATRLNAEYERLYTGTLADQGAFLHTRERRPMRGCTG